MTPPSVQLLDYADPLTRTLEQGKQAENLVAALRACRRDFIELDFSGVDGVSLAFSALFFRLAGRELADIWLAPRHYDASCNRMVKPLVERLRKQRERAWIAGCETFATASHPQAT